MRPNLKLVEKQPIQLKDLQLPNEGDEETYSLHGVLAGRDLWWPALASFFIKQHSEKGATVLDASCGFGTACLESVVLGRIPVGVSTSPLAVKITNAKCQPADLTEVTMQIQLANLQRPVPINLYSDEIKPFFDLDTFRELVALRGLIDSNYSQVARYIELITLGILHGPSAGYLSVSTSAVLAPTASEQDRLNISKQQFPSYRQLAPRVLKRAALLFRDGIGSMISNTGKQGKFGLADPRNLKGLASGSIALALYALPLPGRDANEVFPGQWVREWYARVPRASEQVLTVPNWGQYIVDTLNELSRVVAANKKAILLIPSRTEKLLEKRYDEELVNFIQQNFSDIWEIESWYKVPVKSQIVRAEKTPAVYPVVLRRK